MTSRFASDRPVGAVLEGADPAEPLLNAAKLSEPPRLKDLLSQNHYQQVALDDCLRIHSELEVVDGQRYVTALPGTNLAYIIQTAAENAQSVPLGAAIDFAKSSRLSASKYIKRDTVAAVVSSGNLSLCETLLTGDPEFVNRDLGHGLRPLSLARLQKLESVEEWLIRHKADTSARVPRMFQPRE